MLQELNCTSLLRWFTSFHFYNQKGIIVQMYYNYICDIIIKYQTYHILLYLSAYFMKAQKTHKLIHLPIFVLMLDHRLRRWPNIKPTLVQRLVFVGRREDVMASVTRGVCLHAVRWFTQPQRGGGRRGGVCGDWQYQIP